jgi:hypothetical protein
MVTGRSIKNRRQGTSYSASCQVETPRRRDGGVVALVQENNDEHFH